MIEQYNRAVATHYAAYRPPLHRVILKRVFSDSETFSEGLDVGCGTGYSATALAAYCAHVYGVDPSQSMLDEATRHKKITYLEGAGESVPLPNRSVDVVTLGGSLFYADLNATAQELKRVCRKAAVIAPYDFEVLLDEALEQRGIDLPATESDYDRRVNFSGVAGFIEIRAEREQVSLATTTSELAHVLLSDRRRYEAIANAYDTADPFLELERQLNSSDEPPSIKADLYYAKYQLAAEDERPT